MVAVLIFILIVALLLMSASAFLSVLQNIEGFMDVVMLIVLFITFIFSLFLTIGGIGYLLGY